MKGLLKILIALTAISALALGGWWYLQNNPQALQEILIKLEIQ